MAYLPRIDRTTLLDILNSVRMSVLTNNQTQAIYPELQI